MENVIDIDKLENRVSQSDGSWIAACPECRREGRDRTGNHLRVWPDKRFHCILAGRDKIHNKNILNLIGTEPTDEVIQNYYKEPEPKIKKEKHWDISILNDLVKNYDYWIKKNISMETCEYFKIGVAAKGQLNGRSVIPIFDKVIPDRIIGFSGRMIHYTKEHKENNIPKWKHLGPSSKFLWPQHKDEKFDKILLVESPGCIIKLYENGVRNAKCLFGTNVSSTLMAYLILQNPQEILIATNNELDSANKGVGNYSAIKIKEQLLQFFEEHKIKIALPYLKDFGDMNEKQIQIYKDEWKL